MEQMIDFLVLPQNWTLARTEIFCDIQTGKKDANEGDPNGKYLFFTCAALPIKSAVYSFEGESIILPGNGANVGLSIYYTGKFEAYQRTYILNNFKIESKFVFYFFSGFWEQNLGKQYGSATNYIRLGNITNFTLPLAPLPEQKRIVAKIEELFTKLDAGVEALKKVQQELKRYRQAVLKNAFEGKLTAEWREKNKDKLEPASKLLERIAKEREKTVKSKTKKLLPLDTSELPELPEGWEWTKVHSVCETTSGGTPSRRQKKYYGGEIPWLKSGELNDKVIKSAEETITEVGLENSSAKIFPKGTLLIALYGATVGKLGILGIDAATNQAVCAIFIPKQLDDKYLFWYLANHRNKLLNLRIGGAQPNISQQIVRDIPFPITDFKEQHKIVEEIEHHFSIAEQIEKTIEQNLKQSDRLRQSILKRAFEGKLVPQDPEDEPAEKLLERIKAEKANKQMERKVKRN